jgi:hypothetical protein
MKLSVMRGLRRAKSEAALAGRACQSDFAGLGQFESSRVGQKFRPWYVFAIFVRSFALLAVKSS